MAPMQITAAPVARDPTEWADACLAEVAGETNPEAQAAFQQLADEFLLLAEEVEGLANTFEALINRK